MNDNLLENLFIKDCVKEFVNNLLRIVNDNLLKNLFIKDCVKEFVNKALLKGFLKNKSC